MESTAVLLDLLFSGHRAGKASTGTGAVAGGDVSAELSGGSSPSPSLSLSLSHSSEKDLTPFNQRLNTSQLGAIAFALQGASRISLIHGPPVSAADCWQQQQQCGNSTISAMYVCVCVGGTAWGSLVCYVLPLHPQLIYLCSAHYLAASLPHLTLSLTVQGTGKTTAVTELVLQVQYRPLLPPAMTGARLLML